MTHRELIADLNAGRLLVSAVGQFDPACEPWWDEIGKRWRCGCPGCDGKPVTLERFPDEEFTFPPGMGGKP